ncbi:MAG: D-glycero-beta-D-manno-heptose 1-phosphate adenylyltransferase [bacterium]
MSRASGADRGPLVVVGDVMLDVDLVGRAERLSPEVPVPVIVDADRRERPGGAALAALLAARSGARVILIAALADDDAARRISDLLAREVELIGLPWGGTTPVKTRVRAGDHAVTRLDSGGTAGVIGPVPTAAVTALRSAAAVLVADYGRGVAADPQVRELLTACAAAAPLVWDPHPRGPEPVPGARLVTPNETEAAQWGPSAGGSRSPDGPRPAAAGAAADGRRLRTRWSAGAVAVTLGARGALLVSGPGAPLAVPAPAVAGGDTCGAGDAFAAAATVALAAGQLPSEAVAAAVAEAAGFVAAGGAAGVEPADRRAAVEAPPAGAGPDPTNRASGRHAAEEPLTEVLARVRARGGRVVATGGCFDLLHAGHVATLEAARALGDCLVVCLNSDASIRRLKGPGRPLQNQADRVRLLAALRYVDAVTVFDEDVPNEVLRRVRPDLWVKGGDYTGAELPEATVLAEWSGEVVTLPYLAGRSTTSLVDQARG